MFHVKHFIILDVVLKNYFKYKRSHIYYMTSLLSSCILIYSSSIHLQ